MTFQRQDNLRPCGCRPAGPHRKECPTKALKALETMKASARKHGIKP